jgi:hypothetical protein
MLTIEAIRENPWNIIAQRLPEQVDALLLELACLAAIYCRNSEYRLMLAARAGDYTPQGWLAENGDPDVHEENETRACDADNKLTEICSRYEKQFGKPLQL